MIKGLVSVIIPCYNNAPYLRQCIDSVLSQTYPNFEIIVIDDGSSDNPENELKLIRDDRLRNIIKITHRGVSTARNIGIEQAQGEYIIFIDGDDWIEPDHIECLINGIQTADSSMILMQLDYSDRSEIYAPNQEIFIKYAIISKKQINFLLDSFPLSSPCNKLYKKELLSGINYLRFDKKITYGEDLVFNLQYLQRINTVKLINRPTYHYVKHSSSSTSRYHNYTIYTLERFTEEMHNTFSAHSEDFFKYLMRYYLWGISNLLNQDCNLNTKQKKAVIKYIISIPEYDVALQYLKSMGIGKLHALLLKSRFSNLIWAILNLKLLLSDKHS